MDFLKLGCHKLQTKNFPHPVYQQQTTRKKAHGYSQNMAATNLYKQTSNLNPHTYYNSTKMFAQAKATKLEAHKIYSKACEHDFV